MIALLALIALILAWHMPKIDDTLEALQEIRDELKRLNK